MCYFCALLGAMEMTRTGTTSFVDMYFHMEDVARATEEAGLRGILSYGIIDPPTQEGREKERKNSLKLLQHIRAMKSPRISFAFGPHAPYTCSEETLLWCRKEAEKENVLVNIHIAETRGEQARFERDKKSREVDYLNKIGFLSDRVLAAHSVWLTKSEVKLYGKQGVRVAHCPVSNMKLAGGSVAPLPEMWEAGVPVGLGTDGPASNNSLDMFDTMKICALAHKAHRWDATIANAQKVLDMATIDGARAIGKEKEIGSIEKGKRADLVLIDLKESSMMVSYSPPSPVKCIPCFLDSFSRIVHRSSVISFPNHVSSRPAAPTPETMILNPAAFKSFTSVLGSLCQRGAKLLSPSTSQIWSIRVF